ncbi:MAG: hypothetical protein HRF50_05020 [Phycisphaerae bacterium]
MSESIWNALYEPLSQVSWNDWRGFWQDVALADRYLVCYFAPLLLVLRVMPGRWLRHAIVLTGLAFIAWMFGAAYALFWLALCVGLYWLGERFAASVESGKPPRWRAGVVVAALIGGGYFGGFKLARVALPLELDAWLFHHAPWVFPFGVRGWSCEPDWLRFFAAESGPRLLSCLFARMHVIGLAYLAMRMLPYFSELARGGIPRHRRTLLNFLAYACYGPNLMQGPIERYNEFHEQIDTCSTRRAWRAVAYAAWRIGLGLFKGLVGTVYLWPTVRDYLNSDLYYEHPERIESTAFLFFGTHLQMLWLFLMFSGYCDISVGMSRLLGYHQAENFRQPWRSSSMRDVWHRWHITVSYIARDYLYFPLGGSRQRATLNLCATFVFIGVWHAPSMNFVAWGVLMGLLMRVNQLWHAYAKRLAERRDGFMPALRRAWLRLWPLPQLCAWALTLLTFLETMRVFFGGSGGWRVPLELLRRWTSA